MNIGFLHSAESNIQVFNKAALALGRGDLLFAHEVRGDLLAAAERAGGLTDEIIARTAAALQEIRPGADVLVLTCSTLGPAVDALHPPLDIPVLRVDEALAREAVRGGGMVQVLCAAPTTIEPTREIFERHAKTAGARIGVTIVPGAWPAYKVGDRKRYHQLIAEAADNAYRGGARIVALAQASMAGAARLCNAGTPLTSPLAGLKAAIRATEAHTAPVSALHT